MATTEKETSRPAIDGFEPVSPEFLRDPYVFFERARREAPLFFHPGPPAPFWVVTKYDEAEAVLTDPETFSSRVLGNVEIPEQYRDDLPDEYFKNVIKALDPPEHTPVRRREERLSRRGRTGRPADAATPVRLPFGPHTSHEISAPGTRVRPGGSAAAASSMPAVGVVVGQRDDVKPGRGSPPYDVRRRLGAVGGRRVGVQIDAHRGHATGDPARGSRRRRAGQ